MSARSASQRLAVVGGGLVGSLLALRLAKLGFKLDVFERRMDLRKHLISAGRSINLALSARGLHALESAGLRHAIEPHLIAMRGRFVHFQDGRTQLQPYDPMGKQCIYSVSRGALNSLLLNAAEATKDVSVQFQSRITKRTVSKEGTKLESENADGTRAVHGPYGRVFLTDGASSALRIGEARSETLSHGYKELTLPGVFQIEKNALHIWPRKRFMVIALPNPDGTFTCTLFLDRQTLDAWDAAKDARVVRAFFDEQFPDLSALLPDLEREFFENPTGSMVTVWAWPWNEAADALMLGDAAHAIVPFFGQGMNCGFEDVTGLLSQVENCALLNAQPSEWEEAFRAFARERKPNSDAIAQMAAENFVEMRDRVADPDFLKEKQIERWIVERMGSRYVPRYSLVSFSLTPYRHAQALGVKQTQLLGELRALNPENPSDLPWTKIEATVDSWSSELQSSS